MTYCYRSIITADITADTCLCGPKARFIGPASGQLLSVCQHSPAVALSTRLSECTLHHQFTVNNVWFNAALQIWITPIPYQMEGEYFGETGYHGALIILVTNQCCISI